MSDTCPGDELLVTTRTVRFLFSVAFKRHDVNGRTRRVVASVSIRVAGQRLAVPLQQSSGSLHGAASCEHVQALVCRFTRQYFSVVLEGRTTLELLTCLVASG